MKKLTIMLLAVVGAAILMTGCGKEKTDQQKLQDAKTTIEQKADQAGKDIKKDAEQAKKDLTKMGDKLTK